MAIFGSIDTVLSQMPPTPVFDVARDYIAELQRPDSAVGRRLLAVGRGESKRHEIALGAFVLEQAYDTKPREQGFFETHRQYIDVQIVIAGEELMEVADIARGRVRAPYNAERDLIMYDDIPTASVLRIAAGDATVFFPADIHLGALRTGSDPVLVRKAVLKLPAAG